MESRLPVNGASIHYEITGSGPLLVLIPVSNGTALFYESLASHLFSHFRVVLYARRGYYRSPTNQLPSSDEAFRTHAADAAALIEHVSLSDPVFVFTSSASASIAVEPPTSHPHLIRTLVLHDPIFVPILIGPLLRKAHSMPTAITTAARENSVTAAVTILYQHLHTAAEFRLFKTSPAYKTVSTIVPPMDICNYFTTEVQAITDYMPDLEKLRQSRYRDKLILLRGREEGPELAREPVVSFAEASRMPLWDVPRGTCWVCDACEGVRRFSAGGVFAKGCEAVVRDSIHTHKMI